MFTYKVAVHLVENNSAAGTNAYTIHDKVKVKVRRKCEDKPTPKPNTPDNETPKPNKPNNETPKELPRTGTSEIVLAIVVVAMIGIGAAYYLASTKQLSKLEANAKGKKSE